jgi:glyoxylase-like metal-dependent hydrolase (beta-lactamase superfamily II)
MRHLAGSSWVIEGPTNLGVIENNGEVILIDSGNDKESGRKINKLLNEKGWRLRAIINTHSNADHIGANDYLQRMTGCEIWAPAIEQAFIEYPQLESSFLWGGFPVKEMTSKFFQAKPSKVSKILDPQAYSGSEQFRIVALPGHFFNMVGVLTVDKVFFLADCMFGENILSKYCIPFVYDVAGYKETLHRVGETEAEFYVMSHGEVLMDIGPAVHQNLAIVAEIEEKIVEIVAEPLGFDEVLQRIADHFGITLDYGQFADRKSVV